MHSSLSRNRNALATKYLSENVLVVDIGGTSVKILASGHKIHRSFPSGPKLTPQEMVSGVKRLAADWTYDAVSIGYPGPVLHCWPTPRAINQGSSNRGEFHSKLQRQAVMTSATERFWRASGAF